MADLVVAHFNEFIAAAGVDPDLPVDRANDLSPFAPNGVYPTVDGWIALSVENDKQFAHLADALADDELRGPRYASADARRAARRVLDDHIAQATRTRVASQLAHQLRAEGVHAEPVATPEDLLASTQLASRGFLTPVEHAVWGRRGLVGIPWRPYGGPPLALGAPPRLEPLDD
jgi:crotonobetainyl-CoA:carnitine CoA-transferase CaiB-like acyl-CoA transferase